MALHTTKKILFDCRLMDEHETGISRYSKAVLSHYQERYGRENVTMIMNPHYCSLPGPKIITKFKPYNIVHFFLFPRILRSFPFDIYHAPFYSSTWRRVGTGLHILTVHDLMYEIVEGFFSKCRWLNALKKFYIRAIVSRSLKNADVVLAVSAATAADVNTYFSSSNVAVIPEGLNVIAAPPDLSILERYGLKKGEYLFYAGNDRPHKNIPFMISAFQEADTSKKLVIAGNKKREDAENVLYIGRVSEGQLRALYMASAAFIYPSLYEGFGLPVLEALSMGTKVFSSSQGALSEFGSQCVYYFSPVERQELKSLIEQCDQLQNPAEEDVRNMLAAYSWDQYGRKLDYLLDSL